MALYLMDNACSYRSLIPLLTTHHCDISPDNAAPITVYSITSSFDGFSFTNYTNRIPELSPMTTSPADQSASALNQDVTACAPDQDRHDVQLIDLSNALLRLDADQPRSRAHERQVITSRLDISNNEAENASLVEKQICLLNLRHVARHHGINLQELHPDAFTNTGNDTTTTEQTPNSSKTSASLSPQKTRRSLNDSSEV